MVVGERFQELNECSDCGGSHAVLAPGERLLEPFICEVQLVKAAYRSGFIKINQTRTCIFHSSNEQRAGGLFCFVLDSGGAFTVGFPTSEKPLAGRSIGNH